MSKIIFLNEPKLSKHKVDSKFNKKRKTLIPHVKKFLSSHIIFRNKNLDVTFSEGGGVSSLVMIVEAKKEKFVLKIPLSILYSLDEARFLKVWEKIGVRVPHVIENGWLHKHQYILMEYINAKPVKEVYRKGERIRKKVYWKLGEILRTMHLPKIRGYGRSFEGKAEFHKFENWFMNPKIKKQIRYVKSNKLLGDEHGSLKEAFKTINSYVKDKKSSYCHDDFGVGNVFATKPLTIFDPNPRFNNGYMDLGRSIIVAMANDGGSARTGRQLINGYFKKRPFDKKVLRASMLLNAYMKFPYWHKVGNLEQIKNIQNFFLETERLLEK